MNYGELKTEVLQTPERQDLATEVASFIRMAHNRIQAELELPDAMVSVPLDPNDATNEGGTVWAIDLPDDALAVRGVRSANYPLPQHNESSLYAVFGKGGGGKPKAYAVRGQQLLLAPGPGDNLVLNYKRRVPDFTDDADTNWLLTNFQDIYLYGALVFLNQRIQDQQQVVACEQLFLTGLNMARDQVQTLKHGNAPVIRGM